MKRYALSLVLYAAIIVFVIVSLSPTRADAASGTRSTFYPPGWPPPTLIQRIDMGVKGTSKDRGYNTTRIPTGNDFYFIPLDVTNGNEDRAGARYATTGDGCITIQALSLYDVNANIDWPAQSATDYGNRKIVVMATTPEHPTAPAYVGPGVPVYIPPNNGYRILAAHDTPGSASTPNYDAWSFATGIALDLAPGTKVFLAVRADYATGTTPDWLQDDASTFLRIVNRSN